MKSVALGWLLPSTSKLPESWHPPEPGLWDCFLGTKKVKFALNPSDILGFQDDSDFDQISRDR